MGYFKKQVRRSAARKQILAQSSPTAKIHPSTWSELVDGTWRQWSAPFVRFEARHADELTPREGFFQAAIGLKWEKETSVSFRKRISRAIKAFAPALVSPTARELTDGAIFWFRNNGSIFTEQIEGLLEVLRAGDYRVFVKSIENPGRIVYQDKHQVAAIRFRDVEYPAELCHSFLKPSREKT